MLQVAPILTDAGESLQIRALSGEQIIFTRMKIGSGTKPAGQSGKSYTDLITPKLTFPLTGIEVANNYATITGQFDTTMITETFQWKEFGLYCAGSKSQTFNGDGTSKTFTLTDKPDAVAIAKVGGSVVTVSAYNKSTGVVTLASAPASGTGNVVISYPDSVEQLYAYSYDASAGSIRTGVTSVLAEQVVECVVAIGDATEVTAILTDSAMYARKADFEDHVNNANNPHAVTKAQVGLGNVPNVATNDQTPTFTVAATLAALVSGETISTSLGKTAKGIIDLIAHLANKNNPHEVTAAQVGAAAAVHTHTISDVSGVVPTNKGGTGQTSVDTTPTSGSSKMVTSGGVYTALQAKAAASHTHTISEISGVVPVEKGGTGYGSVDSTPTNGSNKMVTSGGVYLALNGKANADHNHDSRYTTTTALTSLLAGKSDTGHTHTVSDVSGVLTVAKGGTGYGSVDTTPTSGSSKMVTSGGVYTAIQTRAAASHTHSVDDITGVLSEAKGGTGVTALSSATVGKASKLSTARKLKVALGSTTDKTFDGSADVTNIPISGTLAIANGGTGLTSSPSLLVNLGSTSAANVMAASPRPGVTGTLPVGNGGIGATTLDPAVGTVGARNIYAGTGGMTAGSTALTTGRIYLQYV